MDPLSRVRFDCSEADLTAVTAVTARGMRTSPMFEESYKRNRRIGIAAWVTAVAVVGGVGYAFLSTPTKKAIWVGVFLVGCLAWAPGYVRRNISRAAFNKRLDGLAARCTKERWGAGPPGSVEVRLYPDRLELVEKDQLISRPWLAMAGVVAEDGASYIEFTDRMVWRVPDRAFGTVAE